MLRQLLISTQAVGAGVSELTSSLGLAIEMGAVPEDIAGTIGAHLGGNVLHDLQQDQTLERILSKSERTYRNYIAGRWIDAADGRRLEILDPSDGSHLADIARSGSEDVERAVKAARAALAGDWGRMSATDRGRILHRIGEGVLKNIDLLAELEARDVGKPLKQARADVEALARYCEFYGAAADKVHGDTIPYRTGFTAITLYEPHGVTAHIIPWNYPMQIIGRSLGAALAMGNAAVVKPAEEACLTVIEFTRIAEEAGLPPGALNLVTGTGEEAGAALSGHPDINHISFTGSVMTGALVQAAAARLRRSSAPPARIGSTMCVATAADFLVEVLATYEMTPPRLPRQALVRPSGPTVRTTPGLPRRPHPRHRSPDSGVFGGGVRPRPPSCGRPEDARRSP